MHDIFKNAIIDISGEKPVVSDVKIAQKFDILSHESVA
jgi:hypothetical protein